MEGATSTLEEDLSLKNKKEKTLKEMKNQLLVLENDFLSKK
jgi:hypothetical protein